MHHGYDIQDDDIWKSIVEQEMCASQNTPVYINYQTV